MEQDVLISIIVPVYNAESYLARSVDSILAQTYPNLEIILVDDGARDNSGAICDEYARKDSRIRVIHKENGGLSSARNAGIDIATGEYLGFVDSDDWIEPETYGLFLELAKKYDAKMVCGGRYDVDSGTMERTVGLCPEKEEVISGIEMLGRVFLWDHCDSSSCDKMFHRSLYRDLRYPLGVVCEDVALFPYVAERAERVVMCNRPLYNYYHHGGTISTAGISAKTFHFAQHTAEIYPYIRQKHPQIQNQARYFRIRSLVHSTVSVALAAKEDREKFQEQYRADRKKLCRHMPFILSSPLFGKKERLTNLLLAAGVYRYLRRFYHAIK